MEIKGTHTRSIFTNPTSQGKASHAKHVTSYVKETSHNLYLPKSKASQLDNKNRLSRAGPPAVVIQLTSQMPQDQSAQNCNGKTQPVKCRNRNKVKENPSQIFASHDRWTCGKTQTVKRFHRLWCTTKLVVRRFYLKDCKWSHQCITLQTCMAGCCIKICIQ